MRNLVFALFAAANLLQSFGGQPYRKTEEGNRHYVDGLYEDAVIVVTSDHGEGFGERPDLQHGFDVRDGADRARHFGERRDSRDLGFESIEVIVRVDAKGLKDDTYAGSIVVEDSDSNATTVEVTLIKTFL